MPHSRPRPTRGPLRVWLRCVLQSSLLEKLPPQYDVEGEHDSTTPEAVARRLLAALSDPRISRKDLNAILVQAEEFRSWVDRRLKANRRLLLSEQASADVDRGWLERWAMAEIRRQERMAPAPGLPPSPRQDPMWDVELDG